MHWDANEIFKILPFFNTYNEKPEIKKLGNVELLKKLPFYDELSIVKNKTAFNGYAQGYKIEIVDRKDVIVQLKASKIIIKELFKDLLIELKGFKYQIILCVLLSKVNNSEYTEYRPVYFNSLTKTIVSDNYFLNECFGEKIYKLESWISHGSGWVLEEEISQFLNLSSYLLLGGSTYSELPKELSNPMKGLINIKNNDKKCFLWCHARHLNCNGIKLSRITKKDREIAKSLNYTGVNFPVSKKDYNKIGVMYEININVFYYEDKAVFPVHLSNQCFGVSIDLLLISNHYVFIKYFNSLMFNKNKCKNKKMVL